MMRKLLMRQCSVSLLKTQELRLKEVANYITPSNSAEGAVLDACLKINKLFFKNE